MQTWSSEAPSTLRLVGVGIDAERIDRFASMGEDGSAPQDPVMPHVYSLREQHLCRSASSPAQAWAAAFCCKEALFKALRRPVAYREIELLDAHLPLAPSRRSTQLTLSAGMGVASASADLFLSEDGSSCVAVVHAFAAAAASAVPAEAG